MPRFVEKTDVMFAHMALLLTPALSLRARRCGAAIIEHFNKRTGQCDPSIERLALMLGMSRSVAAEGIAELCTGPNALFEKITHGGRSHRTAYIPLWERMADIVHDWDARMKDGSAPSNIRELGCSTSENSDVNSPSSRIQTDRINRQNKPTVQVESCETSQRTTPQSGRKGRLREANRKAQQHMLLPIKGGVPSRQDAAEAAEARRMTQAINALPSPQEREKAWLAEMQAAG